MLNLYDKEGREITNEPAKCVCDNPAYLDERGVVCWEFVRHSALAKQHVQRKSATLD